MKANLRRAVAAALLLPLVLQQAALAAPPTVQTDETVYINLDYYGAPTDTRIVKGVSLNGLNTFTDYGHYSDVYNMSTYDEPVIEEDSVTWELQDPERQQFFYECIPSSEQPIELPWNFDVSYKLDGVPVQAEQCAGADGLVEISLHAVPNRAASEYYQNNMMLICATGIDTSKTLSIDAPGAQIQSFGTYKFVAFMGMPGEESTFTIRIGSHSFETMGMMLLMAPATLSSLDVIHDLRSIKDRISSSGDDVYTGLSSMLDTMQSMQGGLRTIQSGLSSIGDVRQKLIDARGTLDPKTDAALDALEALAGSSGGAIPTLNTLQDTLNTLNTSFDSMLQTVQKTGEDIDAYQQIVRDIRTSLDNLADLLDDLDGTSASAALALDQLQSHASALRKDLAQLQDALTLLQALPDRLQTAADLLSQVLDQSGLDPTLTEPLRTLLNRTKDLMAGISDSCAALKKICGDLSSLLSTADRLTEELSDLCKALDAHSGLGQDATQTADDLAAQCAKTLERLDELLNQLPTFRNSLNALTQNATSLLSKTAQTLESTQKALQTASSLLSSTQETLRSIRNQSDAGTQDALNGLLGVVGRMGNSSGSSSLQNATDSIHGAIEDGEKDLEEDTNILNIDSSAALQSVTSSQNPSPASLQFVLRTQEISPDQVEAEPAPAEEAPDIGLFGRIARVFQQIGQAIGGFFH